MLLILVALIPTSFVSITGVSTGRFPLSWFMVIQIVLFFISIIKGKVSFVYVVQIFPLIAFLILGCAFQKNVSNAISQALMLLLFVFSIFTSDALSTDVDLTVSKREVGIYYPIINAYLWSSIAVGLQIIVQYIYIGRYGNAIGTYSILA